jgi:tRNA (guanine-N7-)-methyltransferase
VRGTNRLPLEQLQPHLLALPDPPTPLDGPAIFGNDHPLEVEVGFGKGLFLLTAALAQPEVNFLGIEIVRKYQLFTATRMAKRGLRNVRLACADARFFFRDRLASASARAIHVYFPDPWWKKRHQKRRVFTPEFAAQCARVVRPGGRLYLATDVEETFGIMTETLAGLSQFRLLPDEPLPGGQVDYLTNFERKARVQGTPIHRAVYERLV